MLHLLSSLGGLQLVQLICQLGHAVLLLSDDSLKGILHRISLDVGSLLTQLHTGRQMHVGIKVFTCIAEMLRTVSARDSVVSQAAT